MIIPPDRLAAVIFDIDGTLLDSAAGIVAGFRHALHSVGFTPPCDEVLRSDLGPPVGPYFTSLGLGDELLERAVAAYRSYYRAEGMHQAAAYPGIVELLDALPRTLGLGTATAKRTEIAEDILGANHLAGYFAAINGTDERRTTKAETIARTLELLGHPNPSTVMMVGDRHSDIAGAQACGLVSVGVTWGYGSRAELVEAGADTLVDRPGALLDLVRRW